MFATTENFQFDLGSIQSAIRRFGFDGWLLFDFRELNPLAMSVLGIKESGSRRFYYFVPASGEPTKLVHKIEAGALDHLPGNKLLYSTWQELHEGIQNLMNGHALVAMEYSPENSNPYVSRVDAGTVELVKKFGVEVASSGNLIQFFESTWSDEQWQLHLKADELNQQAFELAFGMIAEHARDDKPLRETDVQNKVMDFYHENGMTTYHPPIVAVGPHSGDPHYAPQTNSDAEIRKGDFVLLDMWAKIDNPNGVYSDLTKVGVVGDTVPPEYSKIFAIVAAARDAGIDCVRKAFAESHPLQGWEVDRATRDVIETAGYGEFFVHRTGHNIGRETHGNGAHMDDFETREDRLVMPRTCFSIEPGIYLNEFGIRSEINVFVDNESTVHITGGLQSEILPILAKG